MKLLVFGCTGQIGWELQRSLATLGTVTAVSATSGGAIATDLSDTQAIRRTLASVAPDVIVNAAAYTAVDRAEQEPALASNINADAPGVMAAYAADHGCLLVHYSTDYVFDGSGDEPWRESDTPNPLNVYGRTKLAGEQAITASGCRHLVLRTSWVHAPRRQNFVRTMLKLARERTTISVVDDQIGAPTPAELVADVTARMVQQMPEGSPLSGIYHVASAGATSWHGCASEAVRLAREAGAVLQLTPEDINAISSADYPAAAPRPKNSRLATDKLQARFGIELPDWRRGVARTVCELMEHGK
ncbi:MAG: dTDP-4-dehydrorhamnose reductase [Gammaproteobacteria bacterium]|nr:dTDP-4-dehydrorhamnose reductase [Gammaproteobacteria bacterium]